MRSAIEVTAKEAGPRGQLPMTLVAIDVAGSAVGAVGSIGSINQRCGWEAVEHLQLQSTGIPTTVLVKPAKASSRAKTVPR
jgi:hypothetical protein